MFGMSRPEHPCSLLLPRGGCTGQRGGGALLDAGGSVFALLALLRDSFILPLSENPRLKERFILRLIIWIPKKAFPNDYR